jgi:hypothetical protein
MQSPGRAVPSGREIMDGYTSQQFNERMKRIMEEHRTTIHRKET